MRHNKLALILIFILFAIVMFGKFHSHKFLISPFLKPSLKITVDSSLYQTNGRYGIFIKNLKSGENYTLNENQSFEPGSLYKLWLMAVVFEQIKSGKLSENDVLSENIDDLNNIFEIPDEDAELTEGTIELPVKNALEQMITISHNYAALLLTRKVGVAAISDFLRRYHFNESSLGDTLKTTPSDIASFFEKLYKGEIIDAEYSQKMLEILKRQKVNDKIPKYLPEEAVVAHKTGDIGYFENDAGIVFSSSGDYIFVALSETDSPYGAAERIAQTSKAVFNYFNNLR